MNNRFIFGQFRPSNSFGHLLDPRAKIFYAVYLMILALLTESALFYFSMILGLTLLLRFSGINFGGMARSLAPFFILILITALYHLIFSSRDSAEVISVFGFRVTEGGINMAIIFSLRIILFIAAAFLISMTIAPSEMADSLVILLGPFKKWRIPVNDIGLIIFIAMRFIPVLAEEFGAIKNAQIIRGVDFSGGIVNRAKKSLVLLIPVFQAAIRRADDLAIAIESRGYIIGEERSSFRRYQFVGRDWIFMILSFSLTALIFLQAGK